MSVYARVAPRFKIISGYILERMSPGTLAGRGLKTSACETLTGSPSLPCWWRRFLTPLSVVGRPRFCDSSWAGPFETEGSPPDGGPETGHSQTQNRPLSVFLKQNLMGIGGLRTHIRIVPICGTFLPVDFGPRLRSPQAGAASFGCSVVTCRAKYGLATTRFPRDGWSNEATRNCQSGH